MLSSMSRKGNCWDNAPTESLWGSLKVGRLYGKKFATQREAMDEVIDWLTFYNHRRLHSTLGYVSPMRFEENWHAASQGKPRNQVAMDSVERGQGHYDQTGRIWKLDGTRVRELKHNGEVVHVAFSPDGKFIVTSGGRLA